MRTGARGGEDDLARARRRVLESPEIAGDVLVVDVVERGSGDGDGSGSAGLVEQARASGRRLHRLSSVGAALDRMDVFEPTLALVAVSVADDHDTAHGCLRLVESVLPRLEPRGLLVLDVAAAPAIARALAADLVAVVGLAVGQVDRLAITRSVITVTRGDAESRVIDVVTMLADAFVSARSAGGARR